MAWRRGFGEEDGAAAAGESGLELCLGLPAYFSSSSSSKPSEGSTAAPAFALRSNGTNASKPRAAAAVPVVGWPPVRSFRRNLASSSSSSSKQAPPPPSSSPQNGDKASKDGGAEKGMFVKINMDGVPIGRKVDLTAYGGYAQLSAAVDKLFRGLLAAQSAAADGEADAAAAGEMVGGGEYTLVYEDDEGDRMLVGDVPWQMFIATAKRLRVLKSSDLPPPSLMRAAGSRKRAAADS
ncbi:auxin-responsive protein IAA2 isoform X2 [Oryza glaberrima]|uniref:auxin-responsive protein IAA2 isoform X2 n=1 Tax=Oryza glaberrima TaxID=4538 RepID=UPI00023DEF64|nr:auxin-responsive protein IAA2 isoform X2 [Oryza glaberrima]